MGKLLVLAGSVLAMAGAAHAQTASQPSEVLLGIGGYCWQAELEAAVTDTHCFSVSPGGKLVTDVHKVRSLSGRVVYEGVTLYRLGTASGVVRYDYYNSNGDLLVAMRSGTASRSAFLINRIRWATWSGISGRTPMRSGRRQRLQPSGSS